MPLLLLFAGVVLLVTAIQGTTGQLATMLAEDTFGAGGFVYWIVAIGIVGAVGYSKTLRPLSNVFLFLIVLVLFLSHGGVFAKFNEELKKIKITGSGSSSSGFGGPQGSGVPSTDPTTTSRYGPGTLFPEGQQNTPGAVPSYIPGVY